MRTECLLCEAPVIRPDNIAHSKEWLLCPRCRADLQAKVNYAVRQVEIDMVQGAVREPHPQPWYIPEPRYVVSFCAGGLLALVLHWIGWWP